MFHLTGLSFRGFRGNLEDFRKELHQGLMAVVDPFD